MFTPGLVSISFRQLDPAAVIALCESCRLRSIEWGGDIHVPHGDVAVAAEVGRSTRDAGLEIAAYGSYYRAGVQPGGRQPEFAAVLESAHALGAPMVRVWAGSRGSAETDPICRQQVVDDLRRIAAAAASAGIGIALEYHANTLTDSIPSSVRLIEELPEANLTSLWQPAVDCSPAERLRSLEAILGRVSNIHVYHWAAKGVRLPLADGESAWSEYLRILAATGRSRHLLLEFVVNNEPANLPADAKTLIEWVARWS